MGAAMVDEGKTPADLVAAPFATHEPLWANAHGDVEVAPGDLQETTITLFEGPLFLACATSGGKTNVLGPIEVEPVTEK